MLQRLLVCFHTLDFATHARNVDGGYVTAESAEHEYGCVVRGGGRIEPAATAALRARRRSRWHDDEPR